MLKSPVPQTQTADTSHMIHMHLPFIVQKPDDLQPKLFKCTPLNLALHSIATQNTQSNTTCALHVKLASNASLQDKG